MAYITQTDLENRMSAETVRQILDDDNDGVADSGPVDRLLNDASSYVDEFLRGIYTLPLAVIPNTVKRITLDVAVAYAVDRWPDYVRMDGATLLERADKQLTELRTGKRRLDIVGAPEPAANEGGFVGSGNPSSPEPPARVFADGTGDF